MLAYASHMQAVGCGSSNQSNGESEQVCTKTLLWLDDPDSKPIAVDVVGSLTEEIIQNAIDNGEQNG